MSSSYKKDSTWPLREIGKTRGLPSHAPYTVEHGHVFHKAAEEGKEMESKSHVQGDRVAGLGVEFSSWDSKALKLVSTESVHLDYESRPARVSRPAREGK